MRRDTPFNVGLDTANTVRNIHNAQILFDPDQALDRAHANRVDYDIIDIFRCRFMGHKQIATAHATSGHSAEHGGQCY